MNLSSHEPDLLQDKQELRFNRAARQIWITPTITAIIF